MAPLGVFGHDAPFAEGISRLIQPVADLFSQLEEISPDGFCRLRGVFINDGIILVCFERLLPSALAAHDQERKPDRRRAQLSNCHADESVQDGVRNDGYHAGHVHGLGAAADEALNQFRQPALLCPLSPRGSPLHESRAE